MLDKISKILWAFIIMSFTSCSQTGNNKNLLSPSEFRLKLASLEGSQLIDVRTPEEFVNGHLANALHMNISNGDLEKRMTYLDKSKPVFVYCYSGVRSARAGEILRKNGFAAVYDLKGGISKWEDESLPIVKTSDQASVGMGREDFEKIISSHQKVVVDVYAKWCAPCLKMEPDLKKFTTEFSGKVFVLRVEKDKSQELSKSLGVDEIPMLFIYKNGKLALTVSGYQDEAALRKLFEM